MASSSSSNFLTAEEIRKNAATWSLEGDNKLLGFMKIISENLEKRAVTTKKNLNRLVFDIEHTSVALDNAINKFAALQHHQFVENRIREDDEIVKTTETNNVLNNKEQQSHNPIDALKIIVKNGLEALHECYEKISVDIEDSDEEDEQMKSIIYRPKNPFDRRPLPYIIGTNEWKEKWHIGLCDSDEDYSDDNNEQYSSDSESENISLTASLPSNAPTISESEISSTWGPQKNPTGSLINKKKFTNLSDDDDNVEDEISSNTITSKNSSEDSRNHMTQTNLMNNIPIPDQRYYVHQTKEKNLFDESSSNESDNNMDLERDNNNHNSNSILIKSNYDNKNINNIHQKIKSEIEKMNSKKFNNAISNIINDEPPSDIDEVVKDKSDQKYFIENDIEYLSSEIEEKNKNQNINKNDEKKNLSSVTENQNQNNKRFDNNIRQKTVNLFDDDDFNSFMKELDKKNIEKLTNNDIGSTIKAKNLFEDDETEDEDNIFTPKRLMHEPVQTIKVVKEDVSVSENSVNTKYQENKLKENVNKTKISNLFDDKLLDDDDDDFDAIFGRKNPINNKNIENSEKLSVSSTALFSDDKNSNSIHKNSSSVINKNIASSSHTSNLFSEEPPDYDDDDHDVFNIDKNKYTENTAIQKNSSNQNQSQKGINIFSDNNLLNDNDDNDLFSDKTFINDTNIIGDKFDNSISIVDTNKAIESINKLENHKNLFDDKNIENDNQMNNSNNTNVSHQNSKINKSSKTNLFSDDDDDDDDMFNFSNRHRDKSKITTNIVVNEKGIENEENKNINITNVMNKFNSSNITNLFSDNEDEDDDSIFEIIKKSNNSKNTTNKNTSEIKNPIEVDSIVTKNSNKNHQNDKVINQINNDNNEKITINSNISSLMNIFSNEPPTDIENDNDDDDDDILFGTKSSNNNNNNKSMTNNTTEKLKKSLSLLPAEKILDNDKKEEKSGTIKLSSSVSNSHTLLDTISEMDRIKLNQEKFKNNVMSHSHPHREKLFFNNQTPPPNDDNNHDDILFADNNDNESEEKNKKINNYKLMKEQVPKNDCEKIYNLNDNNVSENFIIKSAVENIIRKDKIFDKDNQETDNADKNLVHNNEISTVINSNNTVIMKNENEEFVPKNYDKITSIITEETVVEKITFNDSSSLSLSAELNANSSNNNNNNYDYDNDDISSITNSTDKLSENSINYNTLNYNPVGIFQDIPPPDDDFQISNNDQKQRHNIFYDDFSETIISSDVTTTRIPSLLSSNYNNIFSDEPPPDIFDQQIHQSVTSIQGKIKDKIENNTNDIKSSSSISTSSDLNSSIEENAERKQQSVTELAKKVNDFIKDSESNTTKSLLSSSSSSSPIKLPQPKKLNKKLNINVAALLPGVKRPTTNFASENEKNSNEEISDAIQVTVSDQKYSASSSITTLNDGDDNERNILTSLNKTRAKIPVKRRRPSSRKARHENYRKSLLVSNDEDYVKTNDDYTSNDILKGNNINEIKSLTSNSDQIKKSDNIVTSNNTNVNDNFQSSILNEYKEHKNENLFDDINREDENSIHEQNDDAKKMPNKQISIGFLSSDDDDDDDLFSQNKTIISTSVDHSKKSKLNDLPVATTLSNVITETATVAAATSTISTATVSVVATTKSTATTLKKSDKHFKSIFQDDSGDDDEDDLFGTKSKNRNYDKQTHEQKQKQKQQINPSSLTTHKQSIFSSDEDDDTDLFGGGVKSIKKTAPITSAINHKTERNIDKSKMSSTIKKSGSIFDDNKLGNNENDYKDHDDDDDDDLFGTKNSKNLDKLRTVPIPKKIEKKIIASGKGLSDNPLSDLLND